MFDYIGLWFQSIWTLFGINYPGFGFSIGAVCLGALAATLGLRIIGKAVGTSFSIGDFARSSYNSDKIGKFKKNINISKERQGDQK